uniref:Reverse transcriptase domain-containing protein n=1 Tax=Tanacetum cinerariifolium TaxID=118510 RepID=A0A699HSM1_TANCI|nr:hypothetical protein [Tanacetum cinerariifolium]
MHQPPEESVKEFKEQLKTIVISALEGVIQPPQETSVEILQARENLMQYIQTFLKKFNCISFRETPKVLSLAWEKFFEIQHAFREEDIHELLLKLLEDVQTIREELAKYINSSSWNSPTFYDDDDEYTIQYKEYLENSSNAITPDLPTEEPDNSLNCTLSDDNSFEDIDYVEASPPDYELVSLEEVKDDILCEKLLNINLLNAKIEVLNDNSTPSSLSYSDNSLPEFKTFSDHMEETRSGSTTTHSDYSLLDYKAFYFDDNHIKEKSSGSTTTHSDFSLPEFDSFIFDFSIDPFPPANRSVSHHEEFADELTHIISLPEYDCFEIEPDQAKLASIVMDEYFTTSDDVELLPHHDPSTSMMSIVSILAGFTDESPLKENDDLFDLESKKNEWKKILYDAPIDDFLTEDKCFDPEIHDQIFFPTYVSLPFTDRQYLFFTYVVRILLLYFTYPVVSSFLLCSRSEETIFDLGISAFHFYHQS